MNTEWEEVEIDEVCEEIVDCLNRTAPKVDAVTPYKMIRTSNVRNGKIDLHNVFYVSKEVYKKWTRRLIPEKGDIILTREAPLGEIGILRTDEKVFLGQRTVMYRADLEKCLSEFLYYSLLGPFTQSKIRAFGSGSTVEHMKVPDAKKIKLKVPPLPTQRKIASILSAYDDLIENNLKRIKLLEEKARLTYEEWFVRMKFPGYKNTPINKATGLPEGWERDKLGKLCESMDYGYTASATNEKVGPRFLRITDIVKENIDWAGVPFCRIKDKALNRFLLSKGDIVVARTGASVGSAKLINKINANSVFASYLIRLKTGKKLNNVYAGIYLESQGFKNRVASLSNGAAQPNANAPVLKSIEILLPPIKIQDRFCSQVQIMLDIKEQLTDQNTLLKEARDLLLPRLMMGLVDVDELLSS